MGRHARACRMFCKITNGQYLWERLTYASTYTSREATVLSSCFSLVWSSLPKAVWNKSPIPLEKVDWFWWFFACSYLHLAKYPLKQPKFALLGWLCQAQSLSQSNCQMFLNLKKLKTIGGIKLIVCFHWSYKKYHAILGYAANQ